MKEVIITDEAKFDLLLIEDYIFNKYNLAILLEFSNKFDTAIDLLREGNVIFVRYENTKFRKLLLTKHNSIIYEDTETHISVIKILQNFQDPTENLKYFDDED